MVVVLMFVKHISIDALNTLQYEGQYSKYICNVQCMYKIRKRDTGKHVIYIIISSRINTYTQHIILFYTIFWWWIHLGSLWFQLNTHSYTLSFQSTYSTRTRMCWEFIRKWLTKPLQFKYLIYDNVMIVNAAILLTLYE